MQGENSVSLDKNPFRGDEIHPRSLLNEVSSSSIFYD